MQVFKFIVPHTYEYLVYEPLMSSLFLSCKWDTYIDIPIFQVEHTQNIKWWIHLYKLIISGFTFTIYRIYVLNHFYFSSIFNVLTFWDLNDFLCFILIYLLHFGYINVYYFNGCSRNYSIYSSHFSKFSSVYMTICKYLRTICKMM